MSQVITKMDETERRKPKSGRIEKYRKVSQLE